MQSQSPQVSNLLGIDAYLCRLFVPVIWASYHNCILAKGRDKICVVIFKIPCFFSNYLFSIVFDVKDRAFQNLLVFIFKGIKNGIWPKIFILNEPVVPRLFVHGCII